MHGGAVLDLHRLLEEHGGLLATHELYSHGITRGGVAALVRRGALRRVRQGWFARPDLAMEAVHATRVGGVISCATALRAHGIWAVDDHRLHVLVGHGASRLRTPGDARRRLTERPISNVRVHWAVKRSSENRLMASPVDALTALRECQSRELYLASLDSALHVAPSLHEEMAARGHPVGRDGIDGICESGTETLFRLRMAGRTPRLRCQVLIAGVGRADFLVGEAFVVEIDGREFHDTASAFENDRRRDAELSRRGYRVLRFSYAQVMHDWPAVEAAVLAAISRGDHQR